jgi:2-polyprenyl-3-methyl-5-hydroxy-6-metoxy-1,4-benzoquinol methylase
MAAIGMIRSLVAAIRHLGVATPAPSPPSPDPRLVYALNEISELRQFVRMLLADSPTYKAFAGQTAQSFDAQWEHIPHGPMMLSDPAFAEEGVRRLTDLAGRPREWFAGKTILDAGCGNGRWSMTFARLGAQVTAIDVSSAGIAEVTRMSADFPRFKAVQCNILDPIPLSDRFDVVWNFGVAHHTGDTRRALQNVSEMVKPGGLLCTMIYGEPRYERVDDFAEINAYTDVRRAISAMSIAERIAYLKCRFGDVDAHGWFDAASPKINDLHRFDEIREWLVAWRFRDVEQVGENRNLHIRAVRLGE